MHLLQLAQAKLTVHDEHASSEEKGKITEQFIYAKEYELMFWEMSYTHETWLSLESN